MLGSEVPLEWQLSPAWTNHREVSSNPACAVERTSETDWRSEAEVVLSWPCLFLRFKASGTKEDHRRSSSSYWCLSVPVRCAKSLCRDRPHLSVSMGHYGGAILECLTWWEQKPKTAALRRSTSSASVFWDGEALDIDDVSDAELRAITELQRMRAMRSPQQQLLDKNKKKLEKDSVTDLFRRSGKVQQQLLNRPRRVRKVRPAQPHIQICEPNVQHSFTRLRTPLSRAEQDFIETNKTSDIDGATSRKWASASGGHTASGVFVDENRREWRYAGVKFAHETEAAAKALFEQPPPPPTPPPSIPMEEHSEYKALVARMTKQGFSAAERHRILKRMKHSGELEELVNPPKLQEKSYGKTDFSERVWRQGSVETHLSTPGVGLRVAPRKLDPLQKPPAKLPLSNDAHLRRLQGSLSQGTFTHIEKPRNPRNAKYIFDKPAPKWPKPALDVPTHGVNRSASLNDIPGTSPRKLWSMESRAELWRKHQNTTSSFVLGV